MSTSLYAIVENTTYDLSDSVFRYHVGNDGFGMPPVERLSERGPLQDGDSDIGFRLAARTLQLILVADESTETGYFSQRSQLLEIFKPRTTPIKLRFVLPDGAVRQIDTFYTGGLSLDSESKGAFGPYSHKVGVQLKAPDPTWYDPTSIAVNFGISASASGFVVPMPVPFNVGSSTIDQTTIVNYAGTWKTYPIITVYGPITDALIRNETTGEKIDFTGSSISNGDYYVIDTRYGYKTVKDSFGANQIAKLTSDSDLATFSIEAAPDATNGANAIRVTGTGANTSTAVYISYNLRYIGL